MNFFKDAAEQFKNAFLAMPMASRGIGLMLIVAIAIAFAFLVQGTSENKMTPLFGGALFNDTELAEMELAFSAARLNGSVREGKRLLVPAVNEHEFLAALVEAGNVPSRFESAVQKALEQSSPLELNDQFRYRTEYAKLKQIGAQIERFPDVEWAEVQYDADKGGFRSQHSQTASVTVTPAGTSPLGKMRINQIRELVRASFAGLKDEHVTVTDTNAMLAGGWGDEESELLAAKRRIESDYENRIRNLLLPYGDFRLLVTADVDPTIRSQTTKVTYDNRQPLDEHSRKQESETTKGARGGVPGVEPNALAENQRMTINDTPTTIKTSDETRASRGIAGQTYEQSEVAPLQERRVQVSIGLPKTYYESVYRIDYLKENPEADVTEIPPPPADRLAKIREETQNTIQSAVSVLLKSVDPGDDRMKLVQVWDYSDLPVASIAGPTTADKALGWLAESWQTIALLGLALVALLIARGVARSISPPAPASFEEGFGLEISADSADSAGGSSDDPASTPGMKITGQSLQDELTELIESNPDVAANVLRAWIGDAA